MGKSIIQQYQAGEFTVSHRGMEAEFKLPAWTKPLQEPSFNFWSRSDIETFLSSLSDDQFIGLFHASCKDEAVSMRAVTRPKEDESIVELQDECQTRLNGYSPKPLSNPADAKGTSKEKLKANVRQVMEAQGLPESVIQATLAAL